MKKEHMLWFGAGILAGLIFSPQLRKLPLVKQVPTV